MVFARRAVFTSTLIAALVVGARTQAPEALSLEAQRQFLLTADVTGSRPAGKGITGTTRLTLTDGRTTHDASFQSIDDRSTDADIRSGRRRAGELRFVDSYRYNIAAYHLAVLLGLGHMMPVTVERSWNGRRGSLSWWVDDFAMDEQGREEKKAYPRDMPTWIRARQRMFVFAELVADTDRNKGNVLYTNDWRVYMIDFSRAFRLDGSLRREAGLDSCDRALFERLQSISEADVKAAAGRHLLPAEISALLKRRTRLVEHFQKMIKERGETKVLY
jgi:hypothetical protein